MFKSRAAGQVGLFGVGGSELGAEDRVLSWAPLSIPGLLSLQPRVGLVSGAQPVRAALPLLQPGVLSWTLRHRASRSKHPSQGASVP